MAWMELDASAMDALHEKIRAYPGDAERAVNEVMHNEVGPIAYPRINDLINPSGRKFKGHSKSAKASAWQRYDTDKNLSVTVGAKAKWRYLYFPDDGTNTYKHAGNQQFFKRGGEKAMPEIVEALETALTDEWKG